MKVRERVRGVELMLVLLTWLSLAGLVLALFTALRVPSASALASPLRTDADLATVTRIDHEAQQCQDVTVLGARGSGEQWGEARSPLDMGAPVASTFGAFVDSMDGYRVGYAPLIYPAQDVQTLAFPDTRQMFFDGLGDGWSAALAFLKKRNERCPSERFILAGYSQGAMVMHRVLRTLGRGSTWQGRVRSRIAAVWLIADGDRVALEGGKSRGTQKNDSRSDQGVTFTAGVDQAVPAAERESLPLSNRVCLQHARPRLRHRACRNERGAQSDQDRWLLDDPRCSSRDPLEEDRRRALVVCGGRRSHERRA